VAVAVIDPTCVQLAAPAEATEATDTGDPAPGDDDASDSGSGRNKHRPVQRNACSVTTTNIARDTAAILAAQGPRGTPAARTVWNHKTTPERLDMIRRRFELAQPELDRLNKTGVVVPARLELPSYAYGYHEIFQSQLPVYITADSLFHAIFASHDSIVAKLETDSLAPALADALDRDADRTPGRRRRPGDHAAGPQRRPDAQHGPRRRRGLQHGPRSRQALPRERPRRVSAARDPARGRAHDRAHGPAR
jgi:hypothetical protein